MEPTPAIAHHQLASGMELNVSAQLENTDHHVLNAQPQDIGTPSATNVSAHNHNYQSGTVNIALLAQLELNSILKKSNAITAQKDSSEITTLTLVFQDFEKDMMIYLLCILNF